MDRSQLLDNVIREFDLADADVYLLDLIPLIEMIWADERNQGPELSLLYEFTVEHIAELNNAAGGVEVVSVDDVNDFLERFAHRRPDPKLLQRLRAVALELHERQQPGDAAAPIQERILDFCMDIAAACTVNYPYAHHERIVAAEKKLLRELVRALDIAPDAPIPSSGG